MHVAPISRWFLRIPKTICQSFARPCQPIQLSDHARQATCVQLHDTYGKESMNTIRPSWRKRNQKIYKWIDCGHQNWLKAVRQLHSATPESIAIRPVNLSLFSQKIFVKSLPISLSAIREGRSNPKHPRTWSFTRDKKQMSFFSLLCSVGFPNLEQEIIDTRRFSHQSFLDSVNLIHKISTGPYTCICSNQNMKLPKASPSSVVSLSLQVDELKIFSRSNSDMTNKLCRNACTGNGKTFSIHSSS